jgi:hypothetical protein
MFNNFPRPNKKKKQISTLWGVFVLTLLVLPVIFSAIFPDFSFKSKKIEEEKSGLIYPEYKIPEAQKDPRVEGFEIARLKFKDPEMETMKTKGCVADGLLSGYGGDTQKAVDMINRSNCVYLHRALETWNAIPNFTLAQNIMEKITKPDAIYGMFIAEALNTRSDLYYPDEHRYFNFKDMCQDGTENDWGEGTCKPSFSKIEYRKYVTYITQKAMDIGIRSFLFGQICYQDNLSDPMASKIVSKMRDYAQEKNIKIAIGAQTNAVQNESYLKNFDYIEGGVGIDEQGNIESGPCWSRLGSCWALLWNDAYFPKANNVLLNLDWSGFTYDDMATFAKMDKSTRAKTLKNLYNYFTKKNIGFLMPISAALHKENDGCYGPSKKFYSPSNEYDCKDENSINSILGK